MSQQYQTITLTPGETRSLSTRGRVFAVDSATDAFGVRFDNQSEIVASSKRIFGSVDSPEFSRVTIRNTSVVANTITYAISYQQIKIETSIAQVIAQITVAAMKNAPSYTNFYTFPLDAAGGANDTASFTGLDGGGQVRRSISVFNAASVASGNVLQILDTDSVVGHELDPRQAVGWETSGHIKVKNTAATSTTVRVAEIFYT